MKLTVALLILALALMWYEFDTIKTQGMKTLEAIKCSTSVDVNPYHKKGCEVLP